MVGVASSRSANRCRPRACNVILGVCPWLALGAAAMLKVSSYMRWKFLPVLSVRTGLRAGSRGPWSWCASEAPPARSQLSGGSPIGAPVCISSGSNKLSVCVRARVRGWRYPQMIKTEFHKAVEFSWFISYEFHEDSKLDELYLQDEFRVFLEIKEVKLKLSPEFSCEIRKYEAKDVTDIGSWGVVKELSDYLN